MCLLIAAILLLVFVCVLSGTPCFNHYGFIFYFFPQPFGCAQLFFNVTIAFCRFGLLDLCSVKSFSFSFSHDRKFFWVYYSRSTIIVAFKDFKGIVQFSSDFESFHWEISINSEGFSFICIVRFFSLVVFGTLYFFFVLGSLTIIYFSDSFLILLIMCSLWFLYP